MRNRMCLGRTRFHWTLALLGFLAFSPAQAQTLSGFTDEGAITRWLLLGPYKTGLGCGVSVDAMRQDFLTDGLIPGDLWTPQEGDSVATDCGGAAACQLWLCDLAAKADPTLDCGASPDPYVMFFDSPE